MRRWKSGLLTEKRADSLCMSFVRCMYTDAEEVALGEVLESVKKKENGNVTSLDYKKASAEELHAFMAEVLPNYDRDRVHTSDIKKLIQWYNLLVSNGETDFVETEKAAE